MNKIHIKFTSAIGDEISLNYGAEDIFATESKKTIVERLASLKNRRYNPQQITSNAIPYRNINTVVHRKPLRETAYYYDSDSWFRDYDYIVEYNKSGVVTREIQTGYYPDGSVKAAIDATYELNEHDYPLTETYSVSEDGVNWRKWGLIKNIYDKKRTNAVLNRETYGWDDKKENWRYIPSSYLYHLTQVFYDDDGRISANVLWYGTDKDGMATDRITYRYDGNGALVSILWEYLTPSEIQKMEATDIVWHHTNGNYITYGNDIYDIFDDDIRNNAPLSYVVTEYDSDGNTLKKKGRVSYNYDDSGRLILKKTVTGEHSRIFIDRLEYDLDANGSYSEEHVYATDNNGNGVIGLDEVEGYSKTERIFDDRGNIILKNEYVLDDDEPYLDFCTCHTYKDSTPRIDFSTRHTYKYGDEGEILEESIEVKPSGCSGFVPKSRYVYSDFVDIVPTDLPDEPEKKKSIMVTYRNESLFFGDTEGITFTVCDMKGRICMKGKTSREISVNNLSTGLYKVVIGGYSVKFFKK